MRKAFAITLLFFLLGVSAVAEAQKATRPGPSPTALTARQERVLNYLVAHWGQDTGITAIDLAMRIVGGDYTPEDRYVLAVYIREHPEIHRVIRMFGWAPVALAPEEKLTARLLSRAERERRPAPTMAELSSVVAAPPEALGNALGMLERLGIVRPDPAAGGVCYRMTSEGYVNWEGRMKIDFMYHRVQVAGREPLDTY